MQALAEAVFCGARTNAYSVHTRVNAFSPLLRSALWGRLTNVRRLGNSPATACAIGLLACRRSTPPQFPSQETLAPGPSSGRVNPFSPLVRSGLRDRLTNLRPIDKSAPAPGRHISSHDGDATIVGQPILDAAAFRAPLFAPRRPGFHQQPSSAPVTASVFNLPSEVR
jgi:hypothetical protein